MKTFNRSATKNFDLDTAISNVFGIGCEVEKECNFHTSGTVLIDGKGYDWFMRVDRFDFIEAV